MWCVSFLNVLKSDNVLRVVKLFYVLCLMHCLMVFMISLCAVFMVMESVNLLPEDVTQKNTFKKIIENLGTLGRSSSGFGFIFQWSKEKWWEGFLRVVKVHSRVFWICSNFGWVENKVFLAWIFFFFCPINIP